MNRAISASWGTHAANSGQNRNWPCQSDLAVIEAADVGNRFDACAACPVEGPPVGGIDVPRQGQRGGRPDLDDEQHDGALAR